jgi:uncharacterized protein (DUF58 family)
MNRAVYAVLAAPAARVYRGQEIVLEVRLENAGFLPIPQVQVELACRDEYSGQIRRLRATAMLDAKDQTVLRYAVSAKHCGLLTVWGIRIRVTDLLGVFASGWCFPDQKWEISVVPKRKTPGERMELNAALMPMVEDGSLTGRGNDPAAAYELRTYRSGEPLRNIHWKLTAKTDELMVKEFGTDAERLAQVFLDLQWDGQPYTREDWDRFLDTVDGFSAAQLSAGSKFELIWLDLQSEPCRWRICDDIDSDEAMTALLRHKPYSVTAAHMAYKEKLIHEANSAVVCIGLRCEIKREETAR